MALVHSKAPKHSDTSAVDLFALGWRSSIRSHPFRFSSFYFPLATTASLIPFIFRHFSSSSPSPHLHLFDHLQLHCLRVAPFPRRSCLPPRTVRRLGNGAGVSVTGAAVPRRPRPAADRSGYVPSPQAQRGPGHGSHDCPLAGKGGIVQTMVTVAHKWA